MVSVLYNKSAFEVRVCECVCVSVCVSECVWCVCECVCGVCV
jgi:hypothetical protein